MLQFTLTVRDIYLVRPDDQKLKAFRGLSELNHRILGDLLAASRGSSRHPDDGLVDVIWDQFSAYGLDGYMPQAWGTATDRVRSWSDSTS
jgi:hypothetical protein